MAAPEQRPRRSPLPRALVAPVRRVLPKQRNRTVESTPISGMVDWALYRDGHRVESTSFDDAYESALRNDNEFMWIGLLQPSDSEIQRIADRLSLHPLAVEDAIHAHQRPKVDIYGDTLFAVMKTARYVDAEEVIETGEIMIFVSRDFVVSVRHGKASELTQVRRELEGRPEVMAAGPGAVLWAICDRAVDGYVEAINGLSQDIEQIESMVFDSKLVSPTERIYKLKREILEFRRAVDPLPDALDPFVDGDVSWIDATITAYFRDVQDHALRDASRLLSFDGQLSDILQANLAQVTLRQNEDMRRITAWAAILATITSIAGIYGMNFDHMPELAWRYGYFICLGTMFVVSVTLYSAFKRRHWL